VVGERVGGAVLMRAGRQPLFVRPAPNGLTHHGLSTLLSSTTAARAIYQPPSMSEEWAGRISRVRRA